MTGPPLRAPCYTARAADAAHQPAGGTKAATYNNNNHIHVHDHEHEHVHPAVLPAFPPPRELLMSARAAAAEHAGIADGNGSSNSSSSSRNGSGCGNGGSSSRVDGVARDGAGCADPAADGHPVRPAGEPDPDAYAYFPYDATFSIDISHPLPTPPPSPRRRRLPRRKLYKKDQEQHQVSSQERALQGRRLPGTVAWNENRNGSGGGEQTAQRLLHNYGLGLAQMADNDDLGLHAGDGRRRSVVCRGVDYHFGVLKHLGEHKQGMMAGVSEDTSDYDEREYIDDMDGLDDIYDDDVEDRYGQEEEEDGEGDELEYDSYGMVGRYGVGGRHGPSYLLPDGLADHVLVQPTQRRARGRSLFYQLSDANISTSVAVLGGNPHVDGHPLVTDDIAAISPGFTAVPQQQQQAVVEDQPQQSQQQQEEDDQEVLEQMQDQQEPQQLPENLDGNLFWNLHSGASALPSASSWTTDNALIVGDVDERMVMNGHDVQGIPWQTLPFTREDYRATRLQDRAHVEGNESTDALCDVVKKPQKGASFYRFSRNTRRVKCSIVHFQLRNLVWATSNHDVFLMHDASVVHWDAAARQRTPVLDLSGNYVNHGPRAARNALGPSATPLGNVQISTMIAKDEVVIAGGFYGEVVAKNLRTHAIEYNKRITYDENAITNAIDIYGSRVMTSNNDCFVRIFDLPTFTKVSEFRYENAVNHATRQPHGKMVAVAGDDHPVIVMDGETGEKIATLSGHENFNFATGWHPGGNMFATGSQDRTCRIWDARNMSQSLSVLGAHVGAMRSLRFSSCGRFIAMAEPCDFVHIYDVTRGDFGLAQEIDLFGEIAGISISPDSHSLFIGMYDRNYGSLLEFERSPTSSSFHPSLLP